MELNTKDVKKIKEVTLSDCKISLEEFIAVARYGAKLKFDSSMQNTVIKSRNLIDKFLDEGRIIYGVTTGFGENVRYTIEPNDAIELQKRIVRSHSVAVGEPLSREQTRAIMLQMILNAGKGYSGIQLHTLDAIKDFLNEDIVPFAPGEGSVAYLSVEGHIVMALIGEGYILVDGKKQDAMDVLKEKKLKAVELKCKEGLSLLNGTITVTALAMLALYDSIVAMKNVEVVGSLCYEALRGTTKALDLRIHKNKNHIEQINSATNLLKLLQGSEICEKNIDTKVQDCYLLRAMAQIHGAGKRLVNEAYDVILEECHGVSDNPEIFHEGEDDGIALMCGNFDGSYVGTHADMLSMATAVIGNEIERSTDRMVNRNLNDGLPAFLVSKPGLNNGFMIPQYTSAGLLNEIKVLSQPASIDSISTCANQEDPVSMAYFASKKACQCVRKLNYMIAIEYLVALQAIDLLKPLKQGQATKKVHDYVRETISFVDEDRYLHPDIEAVYDMVREGTLVELIEDEVGLLKF